MLKFTSFTILFLVLVFPILMLLPIKMIPNADQPGYGSMGRLSVYGKREFTQYFVSKDKNLVGVGTTIKNPNLANKKLINLNLYDQDNNLIRSTSLNGFNIGDGDFVKFVFEPIVDSKDKKYHFVISSPDASETEIIELFLTGPTDSILEYSYDNNDNVKGGIPMVTYHKPESIFSNVKQIYLNLFSKI